MIDVIYNTMRKHLHLPCCSLLLCSSEVKACANNLIKEERYTVSFIWKRMLQFDLPFQRTSIWDPEFFCSLLDKMKSILISISWFWFKIFISTAYAQDLDSHDQRISKTYKNDIIQDLNYKLAPYLSFGKPSKWHSDLSHAAP